jgi:hypothetical protein
MHTKGVQTMASAAHNRWELIALFELWSMGECLQVRQVCDRVFVHDALLFVTVRRGVVIGQ